MYDVDASDKAILYDLATPKTPLPGEFGTNTSPAFIYATSLPIVVSMVPFNAQRHFRLSRPMRCQRILVALFDGVGSGSSLSLVR